MREDQETLRLVRLYELFSDPEFVKNHSYEIEENGYKMFSIRTEISIPVLGKVAMGAAYISSSVRAIPVLILNHEQNKILRKQNIHYIVRKRKHPTEEEKYFCFPSKNIFKKIVSL